MSNKTRSSLATLTLSIVGLALSNLPVCAASEQDKQDIQNTIIRYKAAIAVNPKNADTHNKLGMAYLMDGELDNAIQ
jgi:tetratricopeptide (TPR) repeat protein